MAISLPARGESVSLWENVVTLEFEQHRVKIHATITLDVGSNGAANTYCRGIGTRRESGPEDHAVDDVADTDVARYAVVRVADEIGVDLMALACGIDYNAWRGGASTYWETSSSPDGPCP